MWFKTSLLIFTAFVFASCSSEKKELQQEYDKLQVMYDESLDLAEKAVASRDEFSRNIGVLRDSVSYLERANSFLVSENIELKREIHDLKHAQQTNKKQSRVSVGVASVKKENAEVSHPDTSTKVAVADSVATSDTEEPAKQVSFIEYVWNKRNRVEP